MKVLVTGGAGFIGSHLVDKLIEFGHEVAIIDNLHSGKKEFLNPKAKFYMTNIVDKDQVETIVKEFSPEAIFHLAAQNEVPYSMEHPLEDLQINIIGTINLLEAAKIAGTKQFIYSNTGGAFYGDVPEEKLPIDEEELILKPTSFYGVSKGSAESYVKLYGNLYKIKWVSLRYSNVYGPRQDGNKEAGVVAIFTQKLLAGEQLIINGDGSHTRDYVYVEDVVEANLKALDFDRSDYFNISTGVRTSTMEVFETLEEQLKTGLKPNFGPPRSGDALHNSLSPKKAKKFLGWEPKTDFKTGVKLTIEYYKRD